MTQPQRYITPSRPDKPENTMLGVDERLKKLSVLDKQAGQLVFTDIRKCQRFLGEMEALLKELDQPDFELRFHLNTALIENQLYNYDLSEIHFQKAIALLEERGDVSQLAESYIDFAGTLLNLEQTEKARQYLTQASHYLKSFPDKKLQAWLICREGYLHLKNANKVKAMQSFLEAEHILEKGERQHDLKNFYFITLLQSGLGTIYRSSNEPQKCVDAFLEVVRLCEKMGMRSRLSWHYLNVGNGYMAIGKIDDAVLFFTKAMKVFDDVNQQARALALANLGHCYYEKGLYTEALNLLDQAGPLFKERRDSNLAKVERWRAKVFEALGKTKKARKHYFLALGHAKKSEEYKQVAITLKDIANWHANVADHKNAYDYQLLYDQAVQAYLSDEKDHEVRELEIKYEAERKEKEAELFKLQATGLQLKALRAQMNPHFMFNALNSIQDYITSNNSTLAVKYLAQFAHLMRQSLEYSELEVISLEKEIEFLHDYLTINEKLRFVNKLTHKIVVDEEIEEDIYGVPTMIIQPYVENAIEHGIRSKKSGHIHIHFAAKDENTILCTVEDNGIGREGARLLQQVNPDFKNHKSMGTKITHDRLRILLKSRGLEQPPVKTSDRLDELTGKIIGTKVEILIPIMEIQMK